jgi:hypothetical protein
MKMPEYRSSSDLLTHIRCCIAQNIDHAMLSVFILDHHIGVADMLSERVDNLMPMPAS